VSADAVKLCLKHGFPLIAVGTDSAFLHQTARVKLGLLKRQRRRDARRGVCLERPPLRSLFLARTSFQSSQYGTGW